MRQLIRAVTVAGIVCFVVAKAPAVDVPTWQVGDWWDVSRTFGLDVSTTISVDVEANLATEETYRLTVVEIADRQTTGGGVVRVYRRTRSDGGLTGGAEVTISGIPLDVRWRHGTSSGEEWVAVDDLSRIHEQFSLNADLQADVILAWVDIATVALDVTLDTTPKLEMADFPIETVGEQWATVINQHVHGRLLITWDSGFPWPSGAPEDIDLPFDVSGPVAFAFRYAGREPRGGFAETYHIEPFPWNGLWYEPSIKEFAEMAMGTLELGTDLRLDGLSSWVTSAGLAPDPMLEVLGFTPERPARGGWVGLSGSTLDITTVTATILGEGLSGQTVAFPTGRFELRLQCPDHDDLTPSTDDAGSFGIEVVAEGIGRKVATVQLDLTSTRTDRRWNLYR